MHKRLVVAGGGAAGFFGAISAAEHGFEGEIIIIEKSRNLLSKVLVSGGGRCNVTHACYDNALLVQHYPRGSKELRGPFSFFSTRDTCDWFEAKGVALKTEQDGRIFPKSNSSQTIAGCLLDTAKQESIRIITQKGITSFIKGSEFEIQLNDDSAITCDYLLLATGGHPKAESYAWIASNGHSIIAPVPSLFTFNIPDSPFKGLEGSSVLAAVSIDGSSFSNRGPLLVTHWGLSGPAVLKLSAMAARFVHEKKYQFSIRINFLPEMNEEKLRIALLENRSVHPSKKIRNDAMHGITQRLWQRLISLAGIEDEETWGQLKKEKTNLLIRHLIHFSLTVSGKTTFREEFVTCGGVDLAEINLRTMESKKTEGLFFAGELLNADGITGGFNFQQAWTSGWLAGKSIAEKSKQQVSHQV